MTIETALGGAREKMGKAIGVLKDELAAIRTGRATPALLSRIVVDYYGTQVPIQQLASFSVPEPRTLLIQPYDKNAVSAMEKAILGSDVGITPSSDGSVIRLN
ncbi:MAG: ribosome-recycling factor, partial [Actinomycetota bacterium]